jgi:hypothetical protein
LLSILRFLFSILPPVLPYGGLRGESRRRGRPDSCVRTVLHAKLPAILHVGSAAARLVNPGLSRATMRAQVRRVRSILLFLLESPCPYSFVNVPSVDTTTLCPVSCFSFSIPQIIEKTNVCSQKMDCFCQFFSFSRKLFLAVRLDPSIFRFKTSYTPIRVFSMQCIENGLKMDFRVVRACPDRLKDA